MTPSPLARVAGRLYRIRLGSAAVFALPFVLLATWYGWSAFAELDRYRRAVGDDISIDAELYQLALHDSLRRDARRMNLPEAPSGELPVYEISLRREDLDELRRQSEREGEAAYVRGHLRKGKGVYDVGVRYRGQQHWHSLPAQKSLKIRLDKGELVDGTRIFNLINDVTPFGLEDQLIYELAREHGLLTPEYEPVWVRLNNVDMGIYRYVAQPTEGLLRRAGRMPGSIFSGNADGKGAGTRSGTLFEDTRGWKQVARRSADAPESVAELQRLIDAVNSTSAADFDRFARDELDLEKFAAFDALDVVFGGDQHDWLSNHKIYFDAYTGRFEPIAWNFRGFKHREMLNLVDHPLLLRLKLSADYLRLRDRAVYELLTGSASVPAMRARVDDAFETVLPYLRADPYWDAYKLLPRVTRFHRFMVRPMSTEHWLLRAQGELAQFATRHRFLSSKLEAPGLEMHSVRESDGAVRVVATLTGYGRYRVVGVTAQGSECTADVELIADHDLDGKLSPTDPVIATAPWGDYLEPGSFHQLEPGVVLIEREDKRTKRGHVRAARQARTYTYWARAAGCDISTTTWNLDNDITSASAQRRVPVGADGTDAGTQSDAQPGAQPGTQPGGPAFRGSAPQTIPRWTPGVASPHRWALPVPPSPTRVSLGPGVVSIRATRVFAKHESVTIAAGTRIEMAPETSLIFHGQLTALGTPTHPIVIAPTDTTRGYRGVALQGAGSAGSVLRHIDIVGGTHPRHGALDYPALLNVHDTRDIMLRALTLHPSRKGGDGLHATYVKGLSLQDITVRNAPADGIDLEFVSADARGLRVIDPGDECLDSMGSQLRVIDSTLLGCPDNAISAGEDTDLDAHAILIAGAKLGVLAKNASRVRISKSLIYRTQTALRTNRKELHHAGASSIGAQDLYAVQCEKLQKRDKGTRLDPGNVRDTLPEGQALGHLRGPVLGLESWSQLDAELAALEGS